MRYKRKKGQNMATVIDIQQQVDKKEKQMRPYSVLNMILDPDYRKKTYDYFNNKYQETIDEKEIFDSWTKRRKRKDD